MKLRCIFFVLLSLTLPAWAFDESLVSPSPTSDAQKTLSVMSWNVWFDNASHQQRYPKILEEVQQRSPDVVFLQEVTPTFISTIKRDPLLKTYHFMTSVDATRSYGQAFLSREPLLLLKEYPLASQYGRDAVLGLFPLNEQQAFILINVHLESGVFERDRRYQQTQQIASKIIQHYKADVHRLYSQISIVGVIWAGDFNMAAEEFPNGMPGFTDSALLLKDLIPTYDVEQNPLAAKTASWFEGSARLDRIWVRSNNLTLQGYRVLNASRFTGYSDHYPIVADGVLAGAAGSGSASSGTVGLNISR